MPKKFYAVKEGHNPGIYSFEDAREQVKGYSNAEWKGFNRKQDANNYLKGTKSESPPTIPKPKKIPSNTPVALEDSPEMLALVRQVEDKVVLKHEAVDEAWKDYRQKLAALTESEEKRKAASHELHFAADDLKELHSTIDSAGGDMARFYRPHYTYYNLIIDNEKIAKLYQGNGMVHTFSDYFAARRYASGQGAHAVIHDVKEELSYVDEEGRRIFQVYTDGAYSTAAGIGVYFGSQNPLNVSEKCDVYTNQAAELAAIKKAYEIIASLNDNRLYEINSDSEYAIKSLTEWVHNWRSNGWRNQGGFEVKNMELLKEIMALKESVGCRNVVGLKKVKAHSHCEGNDMADSFAKEARIEAEKARWKEMFPDRGYYL